ncbi:MAG TPA: hypothetical protein VFJ85_16985 [Acidimicrobiales bacterium]|nr:hypothetical protein [Acidimicrobiales bacterium]
MNAISDGASNLTWCVVTFEYADTHDGARWLGLTTTQHVASRPGGPVVQPEAARRSLDARCAAACDAEGDRQSRTARGDSSAGLAESVATGAKPAADPESFDRQFDFDSVRASRQLDEILRNIVEHLSAAPGADVELTLEIIAAAKGFDDRVRRVVNENAGEPGAKTQEFE